MQAQATSSAAPSSEPEASSSAEAASTEAAHAEAAHAEAASAEATSADVIEEDPNADTPVIGEHSVDSIGELPELLLLESNLSHLGLAASSNEGSLADDSSFFTDRWLLDMSSDDPDGASAAVTTSPPAGSGSAEQQPVDALKASLNPNAPTFTPCAAPAARPPGHAPPVHGTGPVLLESNRLAPAKRGPRLMSRATERELIRQCVARLRPAPLSLRRRALSLEEHRSFFAEHVALPGVAALEHRCLRVEKRFDSIAAEMEELRRELQSKDPLFPAPNASLKSPPKRVRVAA